ncbi:DNA-directed RNA polymerase subunit B [Candidatus Woesearchaeota archaeon]|jgi:DNA-directed RNA polymerase subunit B'|nr:DNA-directed RNA polymerase subunit B [Candidatus Woesearchaeota archaeon]MBT4835101.1 DNA-directed RNA polymerase subunit B [Candidatus Woesearchaeota archaeon]MBT6735237.1 DNA-directed RNA polymerase subunit B [Candidatus Woesearchaeota archaeon]MBT7170043.1 DNA-directed RNA polymerase subunit B [Candidatus Woesearchaeota archaeon]MBT7474861.1 DNA-directed RNA polymerase subunit B [Candidatus Woesearchaeota archaeon]
MVDVFLNEKFVGTVTDQNEFLNIIKSQRRDGTITEKLNIGYNGDLDEIHVETTKGRCRRPLIIVKNGKSTLTEDHIQKIKDKSLSWTDLVKEGIVEYLDAREEENALVALDENQVTKDHSHLEISPITILGICTALVPFSNFGSSSRLIRGSKLQKQGLGVYAQNYLLRLDTDASILHYPQRPITKTFMHDVFNYDQHAMGQNFTIAVMSYQGYNMQDAVILNKGSVERGLGRTTYFKPFSATEMRYSGGLMDEVGIPDKEMKGYRSERDYRNLEDDGIVFTEAKLKADDVLIGKTSPPRFLGGLDEFNMDANTRRESSIALGEGMHGTVDATFLTENEEGNRLVQTRLRQQRIPEIGDKFASRHGQKGVIGLLVPHTDMPFSSRGITPDIIFSPHSIPSRMTVSHLLEVISGKVGALAGEYIDATTFDTPTEKGLRKQLMNLGFSEDGKETFYNPMTGEKIDAKIYTGNIFYLKLKHMVANKMHARAAGRIQLLTRQPVEGRAMGGGLRVGEMEKDCLVAHGASLLLKERFDSDKTILHICETCGMFATYDSYKNQAICTRCGGDAKVSPVEMSYAFKLLLDEVRSLGIDSKIELKEKF